MKYGINKKHIKFKLLANLVLYAPLKSNNKIERNKYGENRNPIMGFIKYVI